MRKHFLNIALLLAGGVCIGLSMLLEASRMPSKATSETSLYAPFCLFNIISPLMSALVALIGWNIKNPQSPR